MAYKSGMVVMFADLLPEGSRWRLLSLSLLATVASVLGSCADRAPERPDFSVGVAAEWTRSPATAEQLGYSILVGVVQRPEGGSCPKIPASTRILVNGTEAPLTPYDPQPGCLQAGVELGPFFQDQTVTVNVEEGERSTGEAVFDGLTPGTAASLTSPADGKLHAGDDIVVRPVPELPADSHEAVFYPLDAPVWEPWGIYADSERLPDGVHVAAPAFTGRAVLVVLFAGTSSFSTASCQGFAICQKEIAATLGPFFVAGVP